MQLKTFQFIKNKGWSLDSFPTELDSENTVVLIFAAPIFSEDSAPIQQLKENFPAAKMIGCSTAGEIFGSAIRGTKRQPSIFPSGSKRDSLMTI